MKPLNPKAWIYFWSWGKELPGCPIFIHKLESFSHGMDAKSKRNPLWDNLCKKENYKERLIIFLAAEDGEALYSQQKQDWELTVAQIMNSLLPNSDLNWKKWGKSRDHSGMT